MHMIVKPQGRRDGSRGRRNLLPIATLLLAAHVALLDARAATVSYASRSLFEAAVGGLQTETFNALVTEASFNAVPLSLGAFAVQAVIPSALAGCCAGVYRVEMAPFETAFLDIDGTTHLLGATGGRSVNGIEDPSRRLGIAIVFGSPITAWGADFAGFQDIGRQRSAITVGGVTMIPAAVSGQDRSFFGFVSDTPFTTVTFSANIPAGSGTQSIDDRFGIDNVSYAAAIEGPGPASVPVPGTSALLGLGLAGLPLSRRCRPS